MNFFACLVLLSLPPTTVVAQLRGAPLKHDGSAVSPRILPQNYSVIDASDGTGVLGFGTASTTGGGLYTNDEDALNAFSASSSLFSNNDGALPSKVTFGSFTAIGGGLYANEDSAFDEFSASASLTNLQNIVADSSSEGVFDSAFTLGSSDSTGEASYTHEESFYPSVSPSSVILSGSDAPSASKDGFDSADTFDSSTTNNDEETYADEDSTLPPASASSSPSTLSFSASSSSGVPGGGSRGNNQNRPSSMNSVLAPTRRPFKSPILIASASPTVRLTRTPTRRPTNRALVSRRPTPVPVSLRPAQVPVYRHPTQVPASLPPTQVPVSRRPTLVPVSLLPTQVPVHRRPTQVPISLPPTRRPTPVPVSLRPTHVPVSRRPTQAPVSLHPTHVPVSRRPTQAPVSLRPTQVPISRRPTQAPTAFLPAPSTPPTKAPIDNSLSGLGEAWLLAHNIRREKLHVGENTDFIPLKWSKDLADSAQEYADKLLMYSPQCGIAHGYLGDSYGGENLAANWGYGTYQYSRSRTPDEVLNAWFDEEMDKPFGYNGHFTQVGWRATNYVGCGMASKTFGSGYMCNIQVCRYLKPGNCNVNPTNWFSNMLEDDSFCGRDCPRDGCF